MKTRLMFLVIIIHKKAVFFSIFTLHQSKWQIANSGNPWPLWTFLMPIFCFTFSPAAQYQSEPFINFQLTSLVDFNDFSKILFNNVLGWSEVKVFWCINLKTCSSLFHWFDDQCSILKKKTVICWELTCAEVVGNLFNGVLDTLSTRFVHQNLLRGILCNTPWNLWAYVSHSLTVRNEFKSFIPPWFLRDTQA